MWLVKWIILVLVKQFDSHDTCDVRTDINTQRKKKFLTGMICERCVLSLGLLSIIALFRPLRNNGYDKVKAFVRDIYNNLL